MNKELKVKAIVTKSIPYHDNDMIVTLVTMEYGVITATARGCLKPKAKLRYASEPFNFGDYILSGVNNRYIIIECSQIDSFINITKDIDAYYSGCFILDSLQNLSIDSQPETFIAAINALNKMSSNHSDVDDVVTEFLFNVLKINGIEYDFKHCNVCGCDINSDAYLKEYDGVVCEHCRDDEWLKIDKLSKEYFIGEKKDLSHHLKVKANILLIDIVLMTIGVKISKNYFLE